MTDANFAHPTSSTSFVHPHPVAGVGRTILFVTGAEIDWGGGGHELWSRTALYLAGRGISVCASVPEATAQQPQTRELQAQGVDLWPRPNWYSWLDHPLRRIKSRRRASTVIEVERLVRAHPPLLVVLSEGHPFPPLELLEFCAGNRLPFVTITQYNWSNWYRDDIAERHRLAASTALRCFFVSMANWRQTEKQFGGELVNAEVVRNPFKVSYDVSLPWPRLHQDGELRLACVGRLDPAQKGQDILLEALATPCWRQRQWSLSLYGNGPVRQTLERLAQKLGVSDRVVFAGFCPVEEIWAKNHVLVVPSRFEGLPLALVEAMLCARPVVATDVAGHAEIVQDGVTGFLAEAATPSSIANALERFWINRAAAESIGKAGRRRITQLVPPDPVRVFAEKLQALAGLQMTTEAPETHDRATLSS